MSSIVNDVIHLVRNELLFLVIPIIPKNNKIEIDCKYIYVFFLAGRFGARFTYTLQKKRELVFVFLK